RRSKKSNTIFAMAPLPLGTAAHPTDSYHVVALLTPAKLVVVGLKPTPKTWFRRLREEVDEKGSRARWTGSLAWYPSVIPVTKADVEGSKKKPAKGKAEAPVALTKPMLVYSWGETVHLLYVSESKISQTSRNPKNGKTKTVEVGMITYEEGGTWSAGGDVLALQWLNSNQIIALTAASIEVYDVRSSKLVEHVDFNSSTLISLAPPHTPSTAHPDSIGDVAHSIRAYKGKLFLLGRQEVSVGTLLTWADRILSFVEHGDFLSAIDLTRSYYVGEAPGNKNGLPDDPQQLKDVVGHKMHDLMVASARYAFSDDRLTDGTHVTPDGRGVDRTSLFENLVQTCARACKALDDYEFLFEDLWQYYEDSGIATIFLVQLELLVLDNDLRHVPPRITQRLVSMHERDGRPDLAERIIWHIDPDCLDINQAINLCQKHGLYDALIYVFTRAIRDYVSPVVELLGLIRRVMQYRKTQADSSESLPSADTTNGVEGIESVIMNAYKIYPYIADILSGLVYPSEEPMMDDEASQAKKEVYNFLFFGRSSMWPPGEGGKLVLTSDEEGGVEPTYPYLRLLIRFDAEAFLHSLDIAFEDAFLNDDDGGVSRLVIINILLDILSSPGLSSADITFVNIFIARNVPKYPQFIRITPTALHNILIGLAKDPDHSTREDRQLAAEYLLSAYTPHDSDRLLRLFEQAGFYGILRSWHRQERQWSPLVSAYLLDPELPTPEKFTGIDDVLATATRSSRGTLPLEVLAAVSDLLPRLLDISITSTAYLVDKHTPDLHDEALDSLDPGADRQRYVYLRYLLGPTHPETDEMMEFPRSGGPCPHLGNPLRILYVSLQCRFHPQDVIEALRYLPQDFFDWQEVMRTCEDNEVYDAIVWALNWIGDPLEALSKVKTFEHVLSTKIANIVASTTFSQAEDIFSLVSHLEAVGRTGVAICLERSQGTSSVDVALEDIWFQLLRSQIDAVQSVSVCCSSEAQSENVVSEDHFVEIERSTLSSLRSLVRITFNSLMSVSSTRVVSFPRLFKRLVESTTDAHRAKGTPYTEFRAILTGILETYRTDGDMLLITKHLVARDVFETVEELTRERSRGWAASRGICNGCRRAISESTQPTDAPAESRKIKDIVVSRTGAIYHLRCLPSEINSSKVP
ncbi:hypothetical protein JAAARDRAFT_130081, partial [Jaapia argillacea MUCL 33604]